MSCSSLEGHIIEVLQREHIFFEREKTYRDLKKGIYRYDFFLPKEGELFELDGPQHFFQVKIFQQSRKDFLAGQERDRRKNSYALAHDIPLYRIPYWEVSDIHTYEDMKKEKYRVKSKFHNDYLTPPEETK